MKNKEFIKQLKKNYYCSEEDNYLVVYTHDKQVILDKNKKKSLYKQFKNTVA